MGEPGYEAQKGTRDGQLLSEQYIQNATLASHRLILKAFRMPPADFDQFAKQYFAERSKAIIASAERYKKNAKRPMRESWAALASDLHSVLVRGKAPQTLQSTSVTSIGSESGPPSLSSFHT